MLLLIRYPHISMFSLLKGLRYLIIQNSVPYNVKKWNELAWFGHRLDSTGGFCLVLSLGGSRDQTLHELDENKQK